MPITVLQIIPGLGGGGGEQACAEIVAGLRSRGDRAIVVSSGGVRVKDVLVAGGEHIERDVATKNPVKIMNNAVWLRDLIRKEKVDIVHARSRAPAWSAWIACRAAPCRFVTTFHAAYKFSGEIKRIYNSVMARGDRVIAISEFVAGYIRDGYKVEEGKLRVVYRGIDIQAFSPQAVDEERRDKLREEWEITDGDRIVLMPGRISRIKGHGLFIHAFSALCKIVDASSEKNEKNIIAVIVGDVQGRKEYKKEIEKLIDKEGISSKVRMVPHCRDMPAAYSLADVVVVPSQVPEGFGRVPVEAMAMGVPVIASNLGATSETVKDGTAGWLLPPDNPEQWSETMLKALRLSPGTRKHMSQAAIQRANVMFSRNAMISATLAVYDDIMKTFKG